MTIVGRIIAVALATLACAPATATCVTPIRETLIGKGAPGCCTRIVGRLGSAGPDLRWVAVNSEGPPDGKLFVVDCGGGKVAETDRLRYVEGLHAGRRIGGLPTVTVTHIPTTGSGIKVRSVALVQYRGRQIRILWNHATLEATYSPANAGQSYEDRTTWRFLQGQSRIEASTVRTWLGGSRKVLKFPAERYCLQASAWHYFACK